MESKVEPSLRKSPQWGLRAPEMLERVTLRKALRRLADAARDFACTGNLEFTFGLLEANWHSGHDALDDLFDRVPVQKGDVFADIGCGKGRVVGFLAARFPEHRIVGVEMDATALFAKRVFEKNPWIEIRHATLDDAFPADATIFYLFPPTDGDLPGKLKALIDERATRDVVVVAKGAMGDLSDFLEDESWSVERVPPPEGWLEQLFCTHFIYDHDKRGPDYHYGLILRKTVQRRSASR
jgi:SAM-dependent methyltransferase